MEPPGGEQMRHLGAPHNGVNAVFYSCSRGKRSIAVDLKSDAGKAMLADLVRETDALVFGPVTPIRRHFLRGGGLGGRGGGGGGRCGGRGGGTCGGLGGVLFFSTRSSGIA